ncbi:LCP family protein [Allokutzneria oryzae]|uniref:LCP family protein n=1 Tax=Allokutzneria oryzae TaxID=1378989 RepID=A0ABV5ZPB3_9PSEU
MNAPYGRSGYAYDDRRRAPARRPRRKVRIGRIVLVVLLVLAVAFVGTWIYVDSSLNRTDALPEYSGRPAETPGTTWLIVGSDSREGLSEEDREELATGGAAGKRTDTMMLLHLPSSSAKPTLVSLPRDSYVQIPGKRKQKLNAAFAMGGPQLLVRTVEQETGLRIDHYAEIGFGGFVGIVDSLGGVDMCIDKAMHDPKAGLDLQPGCQELDGAQALGYVRTRASARADLDRIERQRAFMSAVMDKATSWGTILNPFRVFPLLSDVPAAMIVNNDDHLHHLAGLAWGMRGAGSGAVVTTTVPIGRTGNISGVGSTVQWDKTKAAQLFDALKRDVDVPSSVIVGG